uniref:Uncharacterized protein n=1 Tax=Chromulina nebulosa TaxID=96789 RepID=A0A7S0XBW7_9STRA
MLSEYYNFLDPLSYGYITFDKLHNWLINHMTLLTNQISNKLTKHSKKMKVKFTMNQVIPISTRALLNLMKRFDYYKSKEYIDDDNNDFDVYNLNDNSAKQIANEEHEDINSDIDDYESIQSTEISAIQTNKLEEIFNDDDEIDYEKQRGEDGFIGIGDEYGDDEIGRLLRKVIPR